MFELGVLVLLISGIIVGLVRRGPLGMTGPVLVLNRFEVNVNGSPAVAIEGRASGFVAWLLTMAGLDTSTTLTVTDEQVSFKSAGLSGEIHRVVPSKEISSTHCGYSQPIWLVILGGVILLLAVVSAVTSRDATYLIVGLVLTAIVGAVYVLQRRIAIAVETTGGQVMGLAFKPSPMEKVSINLQGALKAIDRINDIVVAKSRAPLVL
jgi:hypothetical protein